MNDLEPKIEIVPQKAELIRTTDYNHDDLDIDTWPVYQIIAHAAQVSHIGGDTGKRLYGDHAREFVKNLMAWGHWSPFEFFDLTFECTTNRAVSHELVRHRMASYMQESQRYCDYTKHIRFVLPQKMIDDIDVNEPLAYAARQYAVVVANGVKPEDARVILPECTATTILVKMNLREFRHFLKLRLADGAWHMMRELAGLMLIAFKERFPDDAFLVENL